jgi:hypothetical protein
VQRNAARPIVSPWRGFLCLRHPAGPPVIAAVPNLTCLIQEQETLGIVPFFWKDEPQDDEDCRAILRLSR